MHKNLRSWPLHTSFSEDASEGPWPLVTLEKVPLKSNIREQKTENMTLYTPFPA